ncbi:hypothetical protein EON77_15555, partial [bacterium]
AATRDGADAKATIEAFEGLIGILDRRLEDRSFVVGTTFSLVDAHAAVTFAWLTRSLGTDTSRFPKFDAWLKACSSRPAVLSAFKG